MKKLDPDPLLRCRNQWLFIIFMLPLLMIISCSKELSSNLTPIDDVNTIIKRAKEFSDNKSKTFRFVNFNRTKATASDVLYPIWNKAALYDFEQITSVEVPIEEYSNKMIKVKKVVEGATILNTNLASTSRLFICYDRDKKKYNQFIVTKIWTNTTPDLSDSSLGTFDNDALTFIYDSKGALISSFQIINGAPYFLKEIEKEDSYCYYELELNSTTCRFLAFHHRDNTIKKTKCPKELNIGDVNIYNTHILALEYYEAFHSVLAQGWCIAHSTQPFFFPSGFYDIDGNYADECGGKFVYDLVVTDFLAESRSYPFNTFNSSEDVYTHEKIEIEFGPMTEQESRSCRQLLFILEQKSYDAAHCWKSYCIHPKGGDDGDDGDGGEDGGEDGDYDAPAIPPSNICTHSKCSVCNNCIYGSGSCKLCTCPFELDFFVSQNECVLMNYYSITITVKGNRAISKIEFLMQRSNAYNDWTAVETINNPSLKTQRFTFNRRAIVPGTWSVKAVVYSFQERIESNTILVREIFPDATTILYSESNLIGEFEKLWNDTKEFAKKHADTGIVIEYGGWIYIDTSNGYYSLETGPDFVTSEPVVPDNSIVGSIEFITPKTIRPNDPLVTGKYYVANFHTHYPITYVEEVITKPSGASDNDIKAAAKLGIPGFLYDYCESLKSGHLIDEPSDIFIFGEERRTLPY